MSAQGAIKVRNKVSELQTKLSHAAKQSLSRRFGALYDKLYRKDVLYESWKRVKANKGAPGVDRHDFEYIETVIGVERFLGEIREELRRYRYKPQPVLRCYIDKPGRSEKRPLGIPVIKDRVIPMAAKLVIEPIFEANFLQCSYCFRPGRSAHHIGGHLLLATIYSEVGREEEARVHVAEALRVNPQLSLEVLRQRLPAAPPDRVIDALRKAGLPD